MSITTTTATRTTTSATAAVVVPPSADGARKSWRRMVTKVDAAQRSTFGLEGPWLDPDVAYQLPVGAVVIACDQHPRHRDIRMLRVDVGGLVEEKSWRQKAALGARVVQYIARRVTPLATTKVVRLEAQPNKWDGWCARCREPVPARTGQVVVLGDRNRVTHRGECPPVPPKAPPPNRFPGRCHLCDGWVDRGDGVVVERPDDLLRDRVIQHAGVCPEERVDPPNRWDTWCVDCGELVQAGTGRHYRGTRHATACPPRAGLPTWRVRSRGACYEPGQTLRVRIIPRSGEPEVSTSAPGYRVLDEGGMVYVVVTVLEVCRGARSSRARVRLATWDEAGPVLDAERALAPTAQPDEGGFRAVWVAEKIGPLQGRRDALTFPGANGVPWLAEITGRDRTYGYRREFLSANKDYSRAGRTGTRGVYYHWTLRVNRIYEAWRPLTWSRGERLFLRANPDGTVREIVREEVEAWLNEASEWMFSPPPDTA